MFLHGRGNAAGQRQHLGAAGMAVVDQHQRMAGCNAGIAVAMALPAAGLDHPAGRQLAQAIGFARVLRQGGEALMQRIGLRGRQLRVLEETAGIAEHRRVGQLARADGDDRIGHVARGRRGHAACGQLLADAGVVQAQLVQGGQAQFDGRDQPAARVLLEHAVAVAETAGLVVEPGPCAGMGIPGVDRVHEFADLRPVGADVLDRRGPRGAGDEGEVFQPGQALFQRPHHQRMPRCAGAGADDHVIQVVPDDGGVAIAQTQHHAFGVGCEQQVAAAAQRQQGPARHLRQRQYVGQGGRVDDLHQQRRVRGDMEGIAVAQVGMFGQLPAGRAHRGATGPRLGASRRRRMASTHSPIRSGPR